MTQTEKEPKGACPCSQGIDRRDFLKVTAMAGLLAGCAPTLETRTPTEPSPPTETPRPTRDPAKTEAPDLSVKKVLYVLPRERYALECYNASTSTLKAYGARITLAALEKKEIVVWGGGTPSLTPDVLLSEVKAADFDAVVFECGQPLEAFNPEYQKLAQDTVAQDKVLGAVCMMPAILAAAGLLKGKQAAGNASEMASMVQQFGVVISDKDPVRDGKIVTASYNGINGFGQLVAEAMME
jgi:protease I